MMHWHQLDLPSVRLELKTDRVAGLRATEAILRLTLLTIIAVAVVSADGAAVSTAETPVIP